MSDPLQTSFDKFLEANPAADVILVSHEIDRSLYYKLSREIAASTSGNKKVVIFLQTHGGDPHAGFRIARCLRHHYEHVRLVVPHLCKSAGTLVAIGASEVAVGNLGELGPLDVQISKRTEMMERSSGLDFTEALSAMSEHAQSVFRTNLIDIRAGAGISTKMAGEFASQLAIGMVAPMYGQIDPIQVGEVHRAMKIAYEYGRRLNDDSKQLKPDALISLVSGYPDHSFVIDRKEAKKLFKSVKTLTPEEEALSTTLWDALFRREGSQCYLVSKAQGQTTEDDDDDVPQKAANATGAAESGVGGDADQPSPPDAGGGAAEATGPSHGADQGAHQGAAGASEVPKQG